MVEDERKMLNTLAAELDAIRTGQRGRVRIDVGHFGRDKTVIIWADEAGMLGLASALLGYLAGVKFPPSGSLKAQCAEQKGVLGDGLNAEQPVVLLLQLDNRPDWRTSQPQRLGLRFRLRRLSQAIIHGKRSEDIILRSWYSAFFCNAKQMIDLGNVIVSLNNAGDRNLDAIPKVQTLRVWSLPSPILESGQMDPFIEIRSQPDGNLWAQTQRNYYIIESDTGTVLRKGERENNV
jgi:hypothetical protein